MKTNTKTIVLVGVLSALAAVLMLFPKFPILPAFPWLDVDFSDVPALLASVSVSPLVGVLVVLIKNLLHLLLGSSTGGIGELSNFICGAALVLTCGVTTKYMFRKTVNKIKLPFTLLIATLAQLVAAILGNYFLMIPLYGIQATANQYIIGGVIPFNLIKDALVCVVFYVVYVFVYPKIQKRLY